MAANMQAVVMIGIAFELVPYLEEHYRKDFSWAYIVWPTCVAVIAHTYYIVMRRILQMEKKMREDKVRRK